MRFEGFLGVVAAAGLCQGCLFPSFDSLTQCEQGCGGAMSVTSSTGTGGGAGGAGGNGGNGGSGGSGGGTGGEGGAPLDPCADPIGGTAHGVLITPLGGYSPFCIDSVEVSFERYKTFLLAIQSVTQADYDALLGLECEGTPRTLDQDGLLHHYAVQQAYEDPFYMHDALPVIGASWCEARIYCRQAGKDLCGHVDGVADDPPDGNFSRWVAACSNNGEYTYSYMSDDPDASKCKVSDCPTGYVHLDDAAPNACEGGVPGLYNMSGNSSEWVDNCVAAGGPGFEDDECFPRGGSCPMGTDYTYCEYGGMPHDRVSGFEYVGFRCCWDAP